MNIPLLSHLVKLIELLLESDAPVVEKAVVDAAVQNVEADPKVQAIQDASIGLLTAAKTLKETIDTPPASVEPATPK
jgi:hypothetical protein